MKSISRPFVALIAALLLVIAQQAALAHMIGHTGAAKVSAIHQDEDGHGAALTLSHVCTTCIAFTALDAFAPATSPVFAGTHAAHTQAVYRTSALPSLRAPTPRARAPPEFL